MACSSRNMYERVLRDVPEFVLKTLIYCDTYVDPRKRRSCLVLTKSLDFIEFKNKQLNSCISLRNTILQSVLPQLQTYKGPKSKSYNNISSNTFETNPVSFYKYMFQNFNIQRIYILIQCWNQLVVLHRLPDDKGWQIIDEYKEFVSLELKHGKLNYCPVVELHFENGDTIQTDFQSKQMELSAESSINSSLHECANKPEFMRLLEVYSQTKAELFIEKEQTARMFKRLHNQCTYGIPTVRSSQIEEKQMLSRCGDVWKRFTPYDYLVIGIPLMNQCLPPNLTILRNIKPVFKFNHSDCQQLQYEYHLYQLKTTFDRLDSIEAFLHAEHESFRKKEWVNEEKIQLLPAAFAVLLIKIAISEIVNLEKCPLIIFYEIHKDLPPSFQLKDATSNPIEMQLQIKNIDFHEIFHICREKYMITFNKTSLQQDILSIIATSIETKFKINFNTADELNTFNELLIKKFNFTKYPFPTTNSEGNCDNDNTAMTVDDTESFVVTDTPIVPPASDLLFYNCMQNCLWFGCLVICNHNNTKSKVEGDALTTIWKFYHPTEQKSWHFFKLLFDDLTALQENTLNIEKYTNSSLNSDLANSRLEIDFAKNLHLELELLCEYYKEKPKLYSEEWYKFVENFSHLQMKTDIIFCKLKTRKTATDVE